MTKTTLASWLRHLETLHPNEMDLGLDRVKEVARRLDLLPVKVPVITIAGTNGKGTTAAVIEALLAEEGSVVGVCSSPHFLRFNERIRVAGKEADDAMIVASFEQIENARSEISLTYFEFATLSAVWIFRQLNVDIMVLEVGLGGRLDAVNIVDASVAVITSIELDHQEWLGSSRESIGAEKAGILRPGQAAVIADQDPPDTVLSLINELGVQASFADQDFGADDGSSESLSPVQWRGWLRAQSGEVRPLPVLPLGSLLPINICAALQALLLIGISFDDIQLHAALARIRLRGRRETIEWAGHRYILDVAHNPAAIGKLLEYISLSDCKGRVYSLFSAMSDKDVSRMIRACAGRFDGWFIGDQPDTPRACSADFLAGHIESAGNTVLGRSESIPAALGEAQKVMVSGDTLVIFGSFFTVASALPLLDKDRMKATH